MMDDMIVALSDINHKYPNPNNNFLTALIKKYKHFYYL